MNTCSPWASAPEPRTLSGDVGNVGLIGSVLDHVDQHARVGGLISDWEASHRDMALAIVGRAHGSNDELAFLTSRQHLDVLTFNLVGGFFRKQISHRFA